MKYKPKVITGKVQGTGYPIDGHVLYLSQWDYDNHEAWHLWGWDDAAAEAVMLTMYQSEKDADISFYDTLKDFEKAWKAKEWEPQCSFCLKLENVEIIEVIQEEEADDTREQLLDHGISLTPRKNTDKGGIICLPLDEHIGGYVQTKHPDWEAVSCPNCGRKCWKMPEVERLQKTQDLQILCTNCALEAGLVVPDMHMKLQPKKVPNPQPNKEPKPRLNRAQRRLAEREAKRRRK